MICESWLSIPVLLIDCNAPLDVLHANAVARVLAVTQQMETFSNRELQEADAVDLKHLSMVATLLLRDGCDIAECSGLALAAHRGRAGVSEER